MASGVDPRWAFDPVDGTLNDLTAGNEAADPVLQGKLPSLAPSQGKATVAIGIGSIANGKLPSLAPILGKATGWTGGSILVSGISLGGACSC